jgi:CelD/BcsL family acetyltransferase involved in cellulose biosynthesis
MELETEWNALLTESVTHVPFLRFEYLSNWWRTRGGGEWPHNAQLVLVTAHENGKLTGIAPLFLAEHENRTSLLLLGSIEISDYLGVLVRPGDLPAFTTGLLNFLTTDPQVPAWQALDLYNILDDSPVIPLLQNEATQRGWKFASQPTDHSPSIPLPGNWETYLAGIDKKQRHEIRRKIRRMEEAESPSRWYVVSDPESLEDEINAFLELMAHDPEKEAFLTEEMVTAMTGAIEAAFKHGYLQLAFLEINGQKAAAYLNFDYLDRIWVYNSGLNREYNAYSPGWVLLGYLLKWANENQREAFDFMRGNEDYKYRFGAIDRFVHRVTLTRN